MEKKNVERKKENGKEERRKKMGKWKRRTKKEERKWIMEKKRMELLFHGVLVWSVSNLGGGNNDFFHGIHVWFECFGVSSRVWAKEVIAL